ncbi:MAG: HD domain-containing protein, partial [Actinomycetota bacterium]
MRHKSDRVRIDLQPMLAEQLDIDGDGAADTLMAQVHTAARAIEHATEDAIESARDAVLGGPRRSGSTRRVAPGVRLEDGIIEFDGEVGDIDDALQVVAAHSETGRPVSRRTRAFVASALHSEPRRKWDAPRRKVFLQILRGKHATSALELLDHVEAWESLIPEWLSVRGLPQHDPYHRLTVDGHLFTTVSEVTRLRGESEFVRNLCDEAGNLDALYLAALLHDVGKASGEDHSVAGERIAQSICTRLGLDPAVNEDVAALVRLHLLIPDTATRRDLDDGTVIGHVAGAVEHERRLRLLYVLAMADGRATGPRAWNEWKAALVHDLFAKTLVALETGRLPVRSDVALRARELESYEPSLAGRARDILEQLPPSYLASTTVADMADELRLLIAPPGPGEVRCHIGDGAEAGQAVVTLCVPDRPGTLARGAGVLAIHRVPVLSARAYVTTDGLALTRFLVARPPERTLAELPPAFDAAFSGRLALEARLLDKIRDYRTGHPVRADVRVLNDASATSTVVEIRAPDSLGLLYALAAGLTDVDLDIHVAKIDTLGHRVVDVFYVRTLQGAKLGAEQSDEVRRAVRHRVDRLLNG